MKNKIFSIFVIAAFLFPSISFAYPSEMPLARQQFQKAFKEGGFQGLTQQIIDCYDKALAPLADLQKDSKATEAFIKGSTSLKVCFIEDFSAMLLDSQIRIAIQNKTGKYPDPSNSYYSKTQASTRIILNESAIFSSPDEFHAYINGIFIPMTEGLF